MNWLAQLWQGMSPCMTPGVNGCSVWWEAWAAIGTFIAAGVALYVSGNDHRKERADRNAAGKLAFISLWPRFHRAQARVADIAFQLHDNIVPDEQKQAALAAVIDSLEKDLAEISAVAGTLDEARAERVVGAVAIAGYVARQARRIAQPVPPGPPIQLWASPVRRAWIKDCDLATRLLLAMASESELAGNAVTGRERPTYTKDF